METYRDIDWSAAGREADMKKRDLDGKPKQQPKPFLFTKIARVASESMSLVFRNKCLNYIRLVRINQCLGWYSDHLYEESNVISICHNHFPVPYLRVHKVISDEWYYNLFKFTFVRNPWDRLVSYWRLYFSTKSESIAQQAKGCDNFSQFVHKCVDKRLVTEFNPTEKSYKLINPQWRWILPDYDFIGCYERLEHDWKELNQKIEATFVLDKHIQLHSDRGSTRRHYLDYYDDTTAKLVEALYRTDIDIFGYKSIECQTPYDLHIILSNLKAFWDSKGVKRKCEGFSIE